MLKSMKSRTKIFSFIVMFAIAILVGSCKKDSVLDPFNTADCSNLAVNVSNAGTAFGTNPSVATCEAYKKALQDYVNGCASLAGYNAAYQDQIDDLDCSEYN